MVGFYLEGLVDRGGCDMKRSKKAEGRNGFGKGKLFSFVLFVLF